MTPTAPPSRDRTQESKRPLLGLRRKPGRLALTFMHMPQRAYAHGSGHLLGHTFLQFSHVGRNSGQEYRAVAMVLGFDERTSEAVICSAWDSDWCRNLRTQAATNVKIDRLSFTPVQRFLAEDEACDVLTKFRAAHPRRVRLVSLILGWADLSNDANVRDFVRKHPFVCFRPQPVG